MLEDNHIMMYVNKCIYIYKYTYLYIYTHHYLLYIQLAAFQRAPKKRESALKLSPRGRRGDATAGRASSTTTGMRRARGSLVTSCGFGGSGDLRKKTHLRPVTSCGSQLVCQVTSQKKDLRLFFFGEDLQIAVSRPPNWCVNTLRCEHFGYFLGKRRVLTDDLIFFARNRRNICPTWPTCQH